MTNKQYSKPELFEIGDAIKATLRIQIGYYRDNPFFRRYWFRELPR